MNNSNSNSNTTASVPREPKSTAEVWCERLKLVVVSGVVGALLVVVFVGILHKYCILQLHPALNFFLLAAAIILLAYVEALHYGVVAIEKWDMDQYALTHPRACKMHKLVDTPVKVKKFLVGRQFFVIFVVFLIAQITSFPHIPKNFAGMPEVMVLLLVQTGLPGIALTLTFGQLVSQLFVEEYTIQFLNMYGNEFVVRLSLAAEYIGVCHFSWLLYHSTSYVFCKKIMRAQRTIEAQERGQVVHTDPGTPVSPTEQNRGPGFDLGVEEYQPDYEISVFDVFKYVWSTLVTLGSCVIIMYGIAKGESVLPVPVGVAFFLFFITMIGLFFLEGLMIAIVGTQYWDKETWRTVYPRTYAVHELVNRPDNVKRFIIGRQFFTVLVVFLLAQVATFHEWESDGYDPVLFFIVVQSGLVGVLVTLAFGQLLPELLAAEFPLKFLNLRACYPIVYISLLFDQLGVGHAAWAFYFSTQFLFGASETEGGTKGTELVERPSIVRVKSAELLHKTGSPFGHDNANPAPKTKTNASGKR